MPIMERSRAKTRPLIGRGVPPVAVIVGVAAVAVVAGVGLSARESFTPLSRIRSDATTLDGRTVRIHGTVGETYRVGQGWAFYVHQGKDTIVVFSKVRTPVTREKIKLSGTVSTGYLDGKARPSIFETEVATK